MTTVTIPRAGVPLTADGRVISREWYRYFHDMTLRVGGVNGADAELLAAMAFSVMQPASADAASPDVFQPAQSCCELGDIVQIADTSHVDFWGP